MKSKVLHIIIIALCAMSVSSCSKDESEKRIKFAKIVESRTSQDLLNDLYVGSDADVEAIARIMNVTPSSIERIREGKTDPTPQFEERIREMSLYYMQNDQSFSKLQSIVDPEYGWYDSILNFPFHHPWWFWTINTTLLVILIFVTILAFMDILGVWEVLVTYCSTALLELLVFLIAWIASLICSPDAMQDSYVDSINPAIEQIK